MTNHGTALFVIINRSVDKLTFVLGMARITSMVRKARMAAWA